MLSANFEMKIELTSYNHTIDIEPFKSGDAAVSAAAAAAAAATANIEWM